MEAEERVNIKIAYFSFQDFGLEGEHKPNRDFLGVPYNRKLYQLSLGVRLDPLVAQPTAVVMAHKPVRHFRVCRTFLTK